MDSMHDEKTNMPGCGPVVAVGVIVSVCITVAVAVIVAVGSRVEVSAVIGDIVTDGSVVGLPLQADRNIAINHRAIEDFEFLLFINALSKIHVDYKGNAQTYLI